jgi:phage terminase large subunit-like protein
VAERTAHKPLHPLTTDHFRKYAGLMVLDNGQPWKVGTYFLEVVDEVHKGIPEVWLDVPEGNAKTTNLSGYALYHADYTPEAMVPMAAASRDQTMWLFGQAAGFIRRTPDLGKRFRIYEGYRRIDALRTRGRIQVFAADDRTGDGVIFTLALLEELHRHPDLRLYRTWRGKLDKRTWYIPWLDEWRQAQIAAISTAGAPGSEYETTKANTLKVAEVTRKGCHTVARTPEMVLHQHALRPGEDVHDLKLVKKANPFPGVTIASLKRKHDSPSMMVSHWSRFVCGIATRGGETAIAPEEWGALPRTEIPRGEPIAVGLDLGWKWDTTAIVPFWMPEPHRRVFGVPEVIVPPRNGTSTPPRKIREAFQRIHKRNPIHTVVLDPNAGGEQLAEWIEDPDGGLGARAIAWSQSNEPQAVAYERVMESIREGWIEHPHDDTLTQHFLNAVAKRVLGNRYRFDRPSSTRQAKGQDQRVIDCIQAGAAVLAYFAEEEAEPAREFSLADYRIQPL